MSRKVHTPGRSSPANAKATGFDLDTAGTLMSKDRTRFDLNRFTARRGTKAIALQGPASFTLDDGTVLIEHLALGVGGGHFTVDGKAGKGRKQEILINDLMEGIGLSLDLKGGRMFFSDLGGSVYSAKLDGSEKRALTFAQGNLTGVVYVDLTQAKSRKSATKRV